MSESDENDERALNRDLRGDASGIGCDSRASDELAPPARQLSGYSSWNHDDIQLNEDSDTRIRDLESEVKHRAINPWYLEKDLRGDRGTSVFDDTVTQGDEGDGGEEDVCLF